MIRLEQPTVLELATQFGSLYDDLGTPEYTIKFCTWGGEEQGLFGSSAWVNAHQEELKDHLIFYVNLDMNHVDKERNNGVVLFGNNLDDMEHIYNIHSKFVEEYPSLGSSYSGEVRIVESSDMPTNSDHAPFVYDINPTGYGNAIVCYGSGSLNTTRTLTLWNVSMKNHLQLVELYLVHTLDGWHGDNMISARQVIS